MKEIDKGALTKFVDQGSVQAHSELPARQAATALAFMDTGA